MATNKRIRFYGLIIGAATMALAASVSFRDDFALALTLQKQGNMAQALEAYQNMSTRNEPTKPTDLAVIHFNMGLCQLELAKTAEQESLYLALETLQAAQACFLDAKRLQPNFDRAGQRLESVAQAIGAYQERIAAEEQAADKLQAQMQALLERLQALVDAQGQLQGQIPDLSPKPLRNRNRQTAAKPPSAPVLPASDVIQQWPTTQETLTQTGRDIEQELSELDQRLSITAPGQPTVTSVLNPPLKLMTQAVAHQENSKPYLFNQAQWPLARREMAMAIRFMEEILRMMAQNSDPESSNESEDMEDEDWEMSEQSDEDGGQLQNMQAKGDFSQGSDMRPLPVPNYSMEDILQEEAENQQFRQQNRSKANAGKVKKDW